MQALWFCRLWFGAVNQYPTEEMKRVLGDKIGLTAQQIGVSGPGGAAAAAAAATTAAGLGAAIAVAHGATTTVAAGAPVTSTALVCLLWQGCFWDMTVAVFLSCWCCLAPAAYMGDMSPVCHPHPT